MKTNEPMNVLMAVAIEAQEREIGARLAGARAEYEERLGVLQALGDRFASECDEQERMLRGELDRLKAAKRAMGFAVRSVSGLLG